MQKPWELKKGKPYPLGATVRDGRINFAAVMNTKEPSGILLYERSSRRLAARLPFCAAESAGNVCCGVLEGLDPSRYLYNFYSGGREYTDPCARGICGTRKKYGMLLETDDYDWEGDTLPELSYADSVFYLLHVKGFTMHRSSGVTHRGTFRGIQEKIPYLKQLGVTTLELMPAYEFEERETLPGQDGDPVPDYMQERYKNAREILRAAAHLPEAGGRRSATRINYWGYKKGSYFAPKASYASGERADHELKDLVRELHRNGMEIILQFYFPREVKPGHILEVLKYWILTYHIDGVHVKGDRIPITLLATEPLMGNRKLLYHDLPLAEIYEPEEQPVYRNLAYYRDDFMYDMRKFLKGDAGMLAAFVDYTKRNPEKAATVNFLTNYYGFTLEDLVSYNRKHNEANGEDNRDGADENFSWNCGCEGATRRTSVRALRRKQKKNAMMLLFLAQGTPLLRAGDEFGQTQRGNNNPYCQDNELTWLHWDRLEKEQEFADFVRRLIALRKAHRIFRLEEPLQMCDYRSFGYPDLSLHGEEAWRADLQDGCKIGLLYCARYGGEASGDGQTLFYEACNLHWQKQRFGLPALPGGGTWEPVLCTSEEAPELTGTPEQGRENAAGAVLPPRTICLFESRSAACAPRRRKKEKRREGDL